MGEAIVLNIYSTFYILKQNFLPTHSVDTVQSSLKKTTLRLQGKQQTSKFAITSNSDGTGLE